MKCAGLQLMQQRLHLLVKEILGESGWEKLRQLKFNVNFITHMTIDFLVKIVTELLVHIINVFPVRIWAGVIERINITGKLDYPACEIRMKLDSQVQLRRLDACYKEPETVEWIEAHLRQGEVLYDIGANVGAYSFVAYAVMAGNCKIYAFEPSFSTFAALCHNIQLNGYENTIVPINVALSDRTELLNLNYTSLIPGASCHTLSGFSQGTISRRLKNSFSGPVLCYRLDDIVHQFGLLQPNHVKIDVDGPELDILNGAEKILSSSSLSSILIEVDEPLREGIVAKLAANSFKIQSIHRRSETISNYIFVK